MIREHLDRWQSVKNATMTTISKEAGSYPSTHWKKKLLISEHSPIRKILISWRWDSLKSWGSVHIVRHKYGIEHFVSSRRTDRTGIDRNALRQDELVSHEFEANAQAIINISRKRLCLTASPETVDAWKEVLKDVKNREPELFYVSVPECVYRGGCSQSVTPEHACGYWKAIKIAAKANDVDLLDIESRYDFYSEVRDI